MHDLVKTKNCIVIPCKKNFQQPVPSIMVWGQVRIVNGGLRPFLRMALSFVLQEIFCRSRCVCNGLKSICAMASGFVMPQICPYGCRTTSGFPDCFYGDRLHAFLAGPSLFCCPERQRADAMRCKNVPVQPCACFAQSRHQRRVTAAASVPKGANGCSEDEAGDGNGPQYARFRRLWKAAQGRGSSGKDQ